MSNEADAVREFIAEARAKGDEHVCLAFDFALAALAAERRAGAIEALADIVAKIKAGLPGVLEQERGGLEYAALYIGGTIRRLLDAEAARP